MVIERTHAEILAEAAKYSPTGFRRRRRGQPVPKMDFGPRVNQVLSDQAFGPLSIEREGPIDEMES